MSTEDTSKTPVERFEMRIGHIGVNATSVEDGDEITRLFTSLFGVPAYDGPMGPNGPVSYFASNLVEVMRFGGRGEKGHIGLWVNDVPAAEKWFVEQGFEFIEESRSLNADGVTRLIYFKQQFGGFAIHLMG